MAALGALPALSLPSQAHLRPHRSAAPSLGPCPTPRLAPSPSLPSLISHRRSARHVTRMAPDEEKMTKRSPLDFPIEWERPAPGRRPDIFPQFSPMKSPLPPPPPADPPYEEEDEEEKKEPEPDPEQDPDQPPEEQPST